MALTREEVRQNAAQREGFWHVRRDTSEQVLERLRLLEPGGRMQDLPEHMWHESFRHYVKNDPDREGGPNLRLLRLEPDRPSLTVTGYIFNKFVHPFEDRYITPREAARLQDFPDDFLFSGTLTSVRQQIGNAVPVRLSMAVAKAIMDHAATHGTIDTREYQKAGRVPALSLFTGAGGMDLGFGRQLRDEHGIGFHPVASIEADEDCCRTLIKNGLPCDGPTNIKEVKDPEAFLQQTCGLSFVPLIFGGPPCQAFSQAGRQKADDDLRGQLVFDFVRFVEALRPTYFVMENVRNLRGVGGGQMYALLEKAFDQLGYAVRICELCSADFGTAQLRVRLFFVGVRKPHPPVSPPVATHADSKGQMLLDPIQPYRTVGEAFAGLPGLCT